MPRHLLPAWEGLWDRGFPHPLSWPPAAAPASRLQEMASAEPLPGSRVETMATGSWEDLPVTPQKGQPISGT